MTNAELHFLGIKVVFKELVDKGYEILRVHKDLDTEPQIIAKQNNQLVMVVVKTEFYPKMGHLIPNVAAHVRELGAHHNAICYFASVGIANSKGETEEEMSKPVVGGEYYINYDGLIPLPF